MSDLVHLIDAVKIRLLRVEGVDLRSPKGWEQYSETGRVVVQELRDELGARIRTDRDPATMALGGVKTSATGGWAALLRNWVGAASKRLGQP